MRTAHGLQCQEVENACNPQEGSKAWLPYLKVYPLSILFRLPRLYLLQASPAEDQVTKWLTT